MTRSFKRMPHHRWLGGVASGLAYALGLPTWLTRLLWFLAVVCLGVGGLVYVLLWIFVPLWPTEPTDYVAVTGDT